MKKCISNFKWQKFSHRISMFSGIAAIALWLIVVGCSNLESDLIVEPSVESSETNSSSTVEMNDQLNNKCISTGQEITDKLAAYSAAYVAQDVEKIYSFMSPDFHQSTPKFDGDRDEQRDYITSYYASGGTLSSFTQKPLERNVYNNDVVYDMGIYNNVGAVNGTQFTIYEYYFMRWVKGQDGTWLLDKAMVGPRGNTSEVNATTNEGPVLCYKNPVSHGHNHVLNKEIESRLESYKNALTSGDADKIAEFCTNDFHFFGNGLNVDRDGLYQYYSQFFQTHSIAFSNTTLYARYVHGNVAYDIGESENIIITNGVQSVRKNHFVIQWEKGQDRVWRMKWFMNLDRL